MADQGNDLGRVNPGDPLELPARTFNIFCETAEEMRRMRGQFGAGPGEGRAMNAGVVTVRNDSGGDRDRFDVLAIGDPIIDNTDNEAEFLNRVTFLGLLPYTSLHKGRFVVLLEPIADGGLGKAVVSGVVQVHIDVSNADHQFADVTNADATKLTSGHTGAEILWKETGTGTVWGIVHVRARAPVGKARWIRFELQEDLNHDPLSDLSLASVLEYWDGHDPDPADEGVYVRNLACINSPVPYDFCGSANAGDVGLACREEDGYYGDDGHYRIVHMQRASEDFDPLTLDVVTAVTATTYTTRQLRLPKGYTLGDPVPHNI
jgi:hypothetical protein